MKHCYFCLFVLIVFSASLWNTFFLSYIWYPQQSTWPTKFHSLFSFLSFPLWGSLMLASPCHLSLTIALVTLNHWTFFPFPLFLSLLYIFDLGKIEKQILNINVNFIFYGFNSLEYLDHISLNIKNNKLSGWSLGCNDIDTMFKDFVETIQFLNIFRRDKEW